jgi:hypothetical protein
MTELLSQRDRRKLKKATQCEPTHSAESPNLPKPAKTPKPKREPDPPGFWRPTWKPRETPEERAEQIKRRTELNRQAKALIAAEGITMRELSVASSKTSELSNISFLDFCTMLKIELTHAQVVLAGVSFDHMQPSQLEPHQRTAYEEMFGQSDEFPPEASHTVAWIKGARMGGSYMCAIRLLHLALTVPLNLSPGEQAFAVCVAPDKRTAAQPYRYITGAVQDALGLREMVVGTIGTETFVIQRPDGGLVRFEILAASAGGSALRGRSYVGALLDESSFFRDPGSGIVNDLELYRALAPRIVTGGQLMVISTAWARRGLLWDLVQTNHGHPVSCIAAIAPTLVVRPTEQNVRIYREMSESDPDNAEREFMCTALAVGSTDFFELAAIQQCLNADLPLISPPIGSIKSFGGIDTGFKRDPSAMVIVRNDPTSHKLRVCECFERPSEKEGASPKVVLAEFRAKLIYHRCQTLACDQHYVQTVRDELPGYGVHECPPTAEFKASSHVALRELLRGGKIEIPAAYKRLVAQLRDLQAVPMPGGSLKLTSRRVAGAQGVGTSHGDIASAFVLAVWAASPNGSVDWTQFDAMRKLSQGRRM